MIGFVILHFNIKTAEDTFNCVKSIQSVCKNKSYKICIVENGSKDGSYRILTDKFITDETVFVLQSEENLGFARGNNLGFLWFKQNMSDLDFIAVLNNDTIIKSRHFYSEIEREYKDSQFDIMGPDIITKDGSSQNPQPSLICDLKGYELLKNKNLKKLESLSHMTATEFRKLKVKQNIKFSIKSIISRIIFLRVLIDHIKKRKGERLTRYSHRIENTGLHGSVLIFSKKYISRYNEAFNPGTFLYKEEDLLYIKALRDKLKLIYNPGIKVYHLEDSSTDSTHGKTIDSEIFKINETLKSLDVIKNYLQENRERDQK